MFQLSNKLNQQKKNFIQSKEVEIFLAAMTSVRAWSLKLKV